MRANGILMHITSLPSPYGIGTMGSEAYQFIDFLKKSGQSYWQILPVCPTSYGDSPYQSFSTFAGNPYMIDLDMLAEDGLLEPEEYKKKDWGYSQEHVDYGLMYQMRYPVLRIACKRFLENAPADYDKFCRDAFWLDDYALFMALKDANEGRPWSEWDDDIRFRKPEVLAELRTKYKDDIDFWKAVQFLFIRQWTELKAYANENGIKIIGDVPIYVSADSVDVWSNPDQFQLDENLTPIEVAGCPPDYFSADGQLWGNPLFDWDEMKKNGYRWWIARIRHMCSLYDVVRIDHFRGFASYYAIPYGDPTAVNGRWKKGPGFDLFKKIREELGEQSIIAEDLGVQGRDVTDLLRETGFPGMKVEEFAFDSDGNSGYKPHEYPFKCVAYTGTHDNEPVLGWFESVPEKSQKCAIDYLNLTKKEGYGWGMMRGIWASAADLTIVTAQDILELGHEARMNTPSTTGSNWSWRAKPGAFTERIAQRLHRAMVMYGRLPEEKETEG